MPYIPVEERDNFAGAQTFGQRCQKPGQLDYVIVRVLQGYIAENGNSFTTYAMVAGVLVLVLFEFVRRVVNGYEDLKIAQNGDVF